MLYVFVKTVTFAQTMLSGTVQDESNNPIPGAHIFINESAGTVTNSNGEFRLGLPEKTSGDQLIQITCIGFKPKKVALSELSFPIILIEDLSLLDEVTILPRDYGKELIVNAIQAIPNNYPQLEERHRGFIREIARWDENLPPIYVAESVIEAVKSSYAKPNRSGLVKVLEHRKYESNQIDSLFIRIYAGGHHIHRFDIVARREAFLNNPDKFEFSISDTLRHYNKDLFKIRFENSEQAGHVYIQDSNFAIVKAEIVYKSFPPISLVHMFRESLTFTVEYEYTGNYWRYKSSDYRTSFNRNEQSFVLKSEFVSTAASPNLETIPYNERLQYRDVLLNQDSLYDRNFWQDYNIILADGEIENLFTNLNNPDSENHEEKNSRQRTFQKILSKIRMSYGVAGQQISTSAYSLNYEDPQFDLRLSEGKTSVYTWGLQSTLEYEIGPGTFVGVMAESPFQHNGVSSYDLSISQDWNVNSGGRPIFISTGLRLGYQVLNHFLDNYSTHSGTKIGNKNFDSGSTDIFLSQRNIRVQPHISLNVEKSKRLSFFIQASYNLPLNRQIGLWARERDEFLFGKQNFIKSGTNNLTIYRNSNDLILTEFSILGGIRFNFGY